MRYIVKVMENWAGVLGFDNITTAGKDVEVGEDKYHTAVQDEKVKLKFTLADNEVLEGIYYDEETLVDAEEGEDGSFLVKMLRGGGMKLGLKTHKHTMTAFAAVEPTCEKDGNIAYWYCEACGKYFSDANGKNEIIIASSAGLAVRFDEDQVRSMGRTATGVYGIDLGEDPNNHVVGMCVINDVETESIMVLSENGFGKRTDVEAYRKTRRHAKGVKTLDITEKTGDLVAITVIKDEDDLMIINKSGTTIRLHADEISVYKNRVTQGIKVIDIKKRNDVISHLSVVPRAEDEPELAEGEAEDQNETNETTEQ